ncbi:MAG TPA: exopolysaccharide biosynthesis protein [Rhizomicrobium sp.]|nr:exopolysaccharide biosynthesis protein [Rhizomicrobium sp.]
MSAIGAPPISTLERVRLALPEGGATIGWLHEQLDTEAVYLLIFMLGLLGVLPGACIPAGLLICLLAVDLMFVGKTRALPASIASRRIGSGVARQVLDRAIAVLKFCEGILPFAGRGMFDGARFGTAFLIFLLGPAMLLPVPLTNVVPALVVAGLALALIEDSLVLCALAASAAVATLGLMGGIILLLLSRV